MAAGSGASPRAQILSGVAERRRDCRRAREQRVPCASCALPNRSVTNARPRAAEAVSAISSGKPLESCQARLDATARAAAALHASHPAATRAHPVGITNSSKSSEANRQREDHRARAQRCPLREPAQSAPTASNARKRSLEIPASWSCGASDPDQKQPRAPLARPRKRGARPSLSAADESSEAVVPTEIPARLPAPSSAPMHVDRCARSGSPSRAPRLADAGSPQTKDKARSRRSKRRSACSSALTRFFAE